jgi:hypothetical protein
MIRPFALSDIPALHRYRKQGLFPDSIPTLTWGETLVPARAALSPLATAMGVFTSVSTDEDRSSTLIGQVVHSPGAAFAHITFLAPVSAVDSRQLQPLLEDLTKQAGGRGAQSVIAEVAERDTAFEALREGGFSIYARQRIWRFSGMKDGKGEEERWRPMMLRDEFQVNTLYNELVPALVQQVEPTQRQRMRGRVRYHAGQLWGYASHAGGPKGVWLQPYLHPEAEHPERLLADLMRGLRPKRRRPLYVCVRSYQGWLEAVLEGLGGEAGARQAVMVKRTAQAQKAAESYKLPAIEGGRAEITTPMELPVGEAGPEGLVVTYEKTPSPV